MRICAVVLLSFLLGSCSLASVRASAGYMALRPSGDTALENAARTTNVNGIRSSYGSEFDLEDAGTPYVRLEAEVADFRVDASGFHFEDSSPSTLQSSFGDIAPGTLVDTELEVTNAKVGLLLLDVVDVELFQLSGGVALNYFDVTTSVRAQVPQTLPNSSFEQTEFSAPVPMLYARAAVNAWIARGELSVAWMDTFGTDLGDASGAFLDVDATVTVSPFTVVDFFGGYRYVSLDAEGRIDGQFFTTNTKLDGWYLGMGVSF